MKLTAWTKPHNQSDVAPAQTKITMGYYRKYVMTLPKTKETRWVSTVDYRPSPC